MSLCPFFDRLTLQFLAGGLFDERQIVGHAGVDTGETRASASDTEADHTLESVRTFAVLEDERATGVTLAGVFATLIETGAQHGFTVDHDTLVPVLTGAGGLRDGRDTDLHQDIRGAESTLPGQSPTGYGTLTIIWHLFTNRWQASGHDAIVEFERGGQFDHGDIVHGRLRIVLRVHGDAKGGRALDTGWGTVVVRAGHDLARGSISDAMGSSDDDVFGDDRTTAEMAGAHLQADDPRVGAGASLLATDDTLTVRVEATVEAHRRGDTALLSKSSRGRQQNQNENFHHFR
jgi:hypothetical protein